MDRVDSNALSILNSTLNTAKKPEQKRTNTRHETGKSPKLTFASILDARILETFIPQTDELGALQSSAPSEEVLARLMDQVHEAGSRLRDRPFAEDIIRYKKAVRNFVHYAVENSFTVEKFQTRHREFKNLKPYVQIKVIDQKLEELAAAILTGQTTQLERVSKLDEITGLLVDLTVTGAIKERDE